MVTLSRPLRTDLNPLVRDHLAGGWRLLDFRLADWLWPVRAAPDLLEMVLRQVRSFLGLTHSPIHLLHVGTANVTLAGERGPACWTARGPDHSSLLPLIHPEARPGDYARLRIASEHPFSADRLASIFEPFAPAWRAGNSARLDLARAQGLVKENAGWIEARRDPGLDLTLYLPRWEAPRDQEFQEGDAPPPCTVLFVEDQDIIRRIGTDLLADLGCQAIPAKNTQHAEELLLRQALTLDLVLLDLSLPRDGCRTLGALARQAGLPLILCGNLPTGAVRRAVAECGAAGFVAKPFQAGDLARALRGAFHPPRKMD